MNVLPTKPLSPEEQQHFLSQMYILLGRQVKSYQKHRNMGESTSVPAELARELTESIEYTLSLAGGVRENGSLEQALRAGQNMLEAKMREAEAMLRLVTATAPQWQTVCRWEALRCLERYLTGYDHLHLAHRTPEELFYPILTGVPEDARGIDLCLFYLNILWLENQIMAGTDESKLELLWDRLPPETLNPCEQLLINGVGKAILASGLDELVFREEEYDALSSVLLGKTSGEIEKTLDGAAQRLCEWLKLKDGNAVSYAKSIVPGLRLRLEGALVRGNFGGLFL